MFINQLSISNFKTIQNLELSGFKKINLLIGKPNVGKSNFLEALSLFTLPYFKDTKNSKLSDLIRIENFAELFHNGNLYHPSKIEVNKNELNWSFNVSINESGELDFNIITNNRPHISTPRIKIMLEDNMTFSGLNEIALKNSFRLKTYYFGINNKTPLHSINGNYLQPPYGSNLMRIIEHHKQLKEEVNQFFTPYNLKLVFDKGSQMLKVLRESEDGDIFLLPYSAIADTLQRIIFYKAAIASNEDSVLLFEEPEAHAFPPYIAHFTQEVIQSESNQFIMTTHSPTIVNDFLENAMEDLAIFMVDYKDNQTVVHLWKMRS